MHSRIRASLYLTFASHWCILGVIVGIETVTRMEWSEMRELPKWYVDYERRDGRLGPPRARIILHLACFPFSLFFFHLSPPLFLSFSLSITLVLFPKAKRDYAPDVARRSEVIHFQRNRTTLFDGTIFHVRSPPCTILRLHFLTIALPGRLLNKAHRFVRACSPALSVYLSIYLFPNL